MIDKNTDCVPPAAKKLKGDNTNNCSNVDNDTSNGNSSSIITLASVGISPEEVQCTVKVLSRIADFIRLGNKTAPEDGGTSNIHDAYSQSADLRPIRKAIASFVDLQASQRFQGQGKQDFLSKKSVKQQAHRQRMKETCEQRKYIDSTQLRRTRIDKLNALLLEQQNEEDGANNNDCLKFLIPDGAAEVEEHHHTRMITNDDSNNNTNNDESFPQLPKLRSCYVCKQRFRELHSFYDQLCPTCAPFNYTKRMRTVDLTGYIAVVTGSRVKIGFHTCLKLLRSNCTVIATTRFPNAACRAYMSQPDFASFRDRIHVYGLDLRDVSSIEAFVHFLKQQYTKVDILINNACQTVRRPAGYYTPTVLKEQRLYQEACDDHRALLCRTNTFEQALLAQQQRHQLMPSSTTTTSNGGLKLTASTTAGTSVNDCTATITEPSSGCVTSQTLTNSNSTTDANDNKQHSNKASLLLFESSGISHSAAMSQMTLLPEDVGVDQTVLPDGLKDINGQQLDLRRRNSWLLKMEEVSTPEVVEAMFINAIAPFILNSRLKPLMMAGGSSRNDRFIVNVSAMEGKFYRYKTPNHPHTNMAKAALNMLTRTSSEDLAANCRIYMNSVDTGWINDENPLEKASKIAKENHFQTPIDEVDAAGRILDPIFSAVSGEITPPAHGMFFKDYKPTEW